MVLEVMLKVVLEVMDGEVVLMMAKEVEVGIEVIEVVVME